MQQPLVTVVTPSFNQGRFIRATIESVLSQDYPAVEYIVMDGGSTDETASVVKDYSSRLTFISERDRGQSHAINKGFHMARGSLMAWINSDDYYLSGAIRHAVAGFARNPGAAAVYGEGYLIDHDGLNSKKFPYTQPVDVWKLVHLSDYIMQQTVFFRRDALNELGYLDEDLHYTMDWDILIRIAKTKELEYIPEFLACLREYPEAKSSAGAHVRALEVHRLLKRHSGRVLPPGSIVYGMDIYQKMACDWIGELGSSRLLRPICNFARNAIRNASGLVIGHVIEHAQGLYSDGWAGLRANYTMPPRDGFVLIEGELPGRFPQLKGQRLQVFANETLVGEFPVAPGGFRIVIDPPAHARNKILNLSIAASHYCRERHLAVGPGARKLAYKLHRISRFPPAGPCQPTGLLPLESSPREQLARL